jgi:hypothetical protein
MLLERLGQQETAESAPERPVHCSFAMSECPQFSFSNGVVHVHLQGALRMTLEAEGADPVVLLGKTLRLSLDLPVAQQSQPSVADAGSLLRLDQLGVDGSWKCLGDEEVLSRVFFELIETISRDLLMVDTYARSCWFACFADFLP